MNDVLYLILDNIDIFELYKKGIYTFNKYTYNYCENRRKHKKNSITNLENKIFFSLFSNNCNKTLDNLYFLFGNEIFVVFGKIGFRCRFDISCSIRVVSPLTGKESFVLSSGTEDFRTEDFIDQTIKTLCGYTEYFIYDNGYNALDDKNIKYKFERICSDNKNIFVKLTHKIK